MGPSMSNPNNFMHTNKQRHMLAYQRKHKTQISLDSKIKIKSINPLTSVNNHRDSSQHKNFMKRQQKSLQDQYLIPRTSKSSILNEQEHSQKLKTSKTKNQNQQKYAQVDKINFGNQPLIKVSKRNQQQNSYLINSQPKRLNTRKIRLNDQSYQIDIEKMKNRRFKSKERYSNIMTGNVNNVSKLSPFTPLTTKQSFFSNSNQKNVSTLQLESQLNPTTAITIQGAKQNREVKTQSLKKNRQKIVPISNIETLKGEQKVREQYYDEYLGSFQSKQSLQYYQKVKQCVSEKKLLKAYRFTQIESVFRKVESDYLSQQIIMPQKKALLKSSENVPTLTQNNPKDLLNLQQNVKKPLKLIKFHKSKDPSVRKCQFS